MKFSRIIKLLASPLILAAMLSSCGGNSSEMKALQEERDSLATAVQEANARYNDMSVFLADITQCIDSVSTQEDLLVTISDPETGRQFTRDEYRKRIGELGSIIDRQKNRIKSLSDSLKTNKKANASEVAKLTELVDYLTGQLEEKEAQLKQLQTELATSKRSIEELRTSVAAAAATNARLTDENNALDQLVVSKTDQLNKCWFMAKTGKELKKLGIISGGNLVKKGKFTPGAVSTSDCLAVDIRKFNNVDLNSKKEPRLLTQAPASSYTFDEVGDGKWRLIVKDTAAFWSLSKIVVVELR